MGQCLLVDVCGSHRERLFCRLYVGYLGFLLASYVSARVDVLSSTGQNTVGWMGM